MKPLLSEETINGLSADLKILKWLSENGYVCAEDFRVRTRKWCEAECERINLDYYWSEIAKELLSSGRLMNERGIHSGRPGFYSSEYLEELNPYQPFGTKQPLHPFIKRLRNGGLVNLKEARVFAEQVQVTKLREFADHGFNADGWTGKSNFLIKLLKDIVLRIDYTPSRIINEEGIFSGFKKSTPGGIEFSLYYKSPPSYPEAGQLQVAFMISKRSDEFVKIYLDNLSRLVEGIFSYATFAHSTGAGTRQEPLKTHLTPESAVLGLHVLVGAFDSLHGVFCQNGL